MCQTKNITMNVKNFVRYVTISALLIFLCVQFSLGLRHDLIFGQCSNLAPNRSVLILTQVVAKQNNKWFSMFRKTDVTLRFPRVGELNVPITCITIIDNEKNGEGGYAMIKEGGINYGHVTIEFVSQTGCDIKFTVYLYGDSGPPVQSNIPNRPVGWVYPSNNQPNFPTAYQPPYNSNNRY